MKQSEKLDLILRELYKNKNDGRYYSIKSILETLKISTDSIKEPSNLGQRLKDDKYINAVITLDDCVAELTSHGIEYCEENSYAYSGRPLINNVLSISSNNYNKTKPMKHSIFISYANFDKDKVDLIVKELETSLIFVPIVIASERRALKPLAHKITEGINKAKIILPILTSNSIKTQWINQEIGYSYAKEKQIVPIIENDIIDELKGFIHKQFDLPYGFSSNNDKVKENEDFLNQVKILIQDMEGKILNTTLTEQLKDKNQFEKNLELIEKIKKDEEFQFRKNQFLNSINAVQEAKKEVLVLFGDIKAKAQILRNTNFDINDSYPGFELSCTLIHQQLICNISWNNNITNSTEDGYLQLVMNRGKRNPSIMKLTFDQSLDGKNCWFLKDSNKQYFSSEISDICLNWMIESTLNGSRNDTNYLIRT